MRCSAIFPVILTLAALVLTCLCLFAGSKTTFLATMPIMTLNTSDFGTSLLSADSSLASLVSSSEATTILHELGLHDFYTANILGYCEGYYVSNSTTMNITSCSKPKAWFQFDPKVILQADLDAAGYSDINITSLDWPSSLDSGLNDVHIVEKAAFLLYVLSAGLIILATLSAAISVCLSGRLSAFINVLISGIAFLAIGLSSAVVTVAGVKGAKIINADGADYDLTAYYSKQFLIFTWIATAAMVVSAMTWCVECIVGRRTSNYRPARFEDKPEGY